MPKLILLLAVLINSSQAASYVPTLVHLKFGDERVTSLNSQRTDDLDKLVENLQEIESRKLEILKQIQNADVEEMKLQQKASNLRTLISLEATLDSTEERKKSILYHSQKFDDEELQLLKSELSLDSILSTKNIIYPIKEPNQVSPFLAAGGLFAAAAFRSSLMNRAAKQNENQYENNIDSESNAYFHNELWLQVFRAVSVIPSILSNITTALPELVNQIMKNFLGFSSLSCTQKVISQEGVEAESIANSISDKLAYNFRINNTEVIKMEENASESVMNSGKIINSGTSTQRSSLLAHTISDEKEGITIQLEERILSPATKVHHTASGCCVFGVGECGSNVVSVLQNDFDANFTFVHASLASISDENGTILFKMQEGVDKFSSSVERLLSCSRYCVLVCESADVFSGKLVKKLAQKSRNSGALTICVVTSPFSFEGASRVNRAKETVQYLMNVSDTVIDIPSNTILEIIPMDSTLQEAYSMVDNIVGLGVKNVLNLISKKKLNDTNLISSIKLKSEFDILKSNGNHSHCMHSSIQNKRNHTDLTISSRIIFPCDGSIVKAESAFNINPAGNVRTFGVGDSGCTAIVNLLPSTINTSEGFGVHFNLTKLNPIIRGKIYNAVHLNLEDIVESASIKNKVIATLDRSKSDIAELVDDSKLCIVTCEAADIFSSETSINLLEKAKEKGAVTVCIVSMPFRFEGIKRWNRAQKTVDRLKEIADTVILIQNDSVLEMLPSDTSIENAFALVDEIMGNGIVGIVNLVSKNGLINANFKDIQTIQKGAGIGAMGFGVGRGISAAEDATMGAIRSPLLGKTVEKAKRIVLSITGGPSMSLNDVNLAVDQLSQHLGKNVDISVSAIVDDSLIDEVRVTIFVLECSSSDKATADEDVEVMGTYYNPNTINGLEYDKYMYRVSKQLKKNSKDKVSEKLVLMNSTEILSLDPSNQYSSSNIIYPYLSVESKAKINSSKYIRKSVENSLFQNKSYKCTSSPWTNDIVDRLFQSNYRSLGHSKLFPEQKKTRQPKLNLLQFSVHERSSTPALQNGLFGKPRSHTKYLRLKVKKSSHLIVFPWNILFDAFDKTVRKSSK